MGTMPETDDLEQLTAICMRLPEAVTDDRHPPHRSFLVGQKNFAWYVDNEHGDGRLGLVVRAGPGQNEVLLASDPERFGRPKYVAHHGWVTYYLDLRARPVDWQEVTELVTDSYRLQAPRRLTRRLDS
jgi:hypothetical protein